MKNFFDKYGALIGFISPIISIIAMWIWGLIAEGNEAIFKDEVENVVIELIESHDFMEGVMTTDYMVKYKTANEIRIINETLNSKDSIRVKFSAMLSAKTGLTVESIADSIAVMILDKRNNKRILSEEEVVSLIKKYNWKPTAEF